MSLLELCNRSLLSKCAAACLHQQRSVVLLERVYQPPLAKRNKPQSQLKNKRYQVYRVLDHGDGPVSIKYLMSAPIQCVLVKHVDGVGTDGDVVTVTRKQFHNNLLPSGSALYASPENIAIYADADPNRIRRTKNALTAMRMLFGMTLKIPMNTQTQWVLDESHIQTAFRLEEVYLENTDSITLPEDGITDHHDCLSPFNIKVKVNGLDEAVVECYIQPHSFDEKIQAELPSLPDMPTHRPPVEVKRRLMDEGLYNGTVDVINNQLPHT